MNQITIITGNWAAELELLAAEDLKRDIEAVSGLRIPIESETALNPGNYIVIGSPATCDLVSEFRKKNLLGYLEENDFTEEGSIDLFQLDEKTKVLALTGHNSVGAQYALYDFCEIELNIDPCSFWTGCIAGYDEGFSLDHVSSRVVASPKVPIRCYFDNDNDELANMTMPYLEIDFTYWKEMIDTLVRLRYNALDLHDHLGRFEYVTREPYLKIRPDYEVNIDLLTRIIDYAKTKGMKMQTSFYLGWQFRSITDGAAHNWKDYKQDWIDTWTYYLEETPIGRSDIFLNRPRDQRLDHPFRGSRGERPADVFNEAFVVMRDLIQNKNPDAVIIADLYSEGKQVFSEGFRPHPPEDFILCWPDDGFGEVPDLPEDLSPYRSGIYMHAGFWRNHVVADPYVEQLAYSMKKAILDRGMSSYCLVNGQTFRHFLLNLEACSRLCRSPGAFDAHRFTDEWIRRYLGPAHISEIKSLLNLMHAAHKGRNGYVRTLSIISDWQKIEPAERSCAGRWTEILEDIESKVAVLGEGYELALELKNKISDENHFFHDHFVLPFALLLEINTILLRMLKLPGSKDSEKDQETINALIEDHTVRRIRGDKNLQWAGWYRPEKARPNGGYPVLETGAAVEPQN
ncbi:MAG: hypothetical protein HN368_07715 [Spirochaetales bacterium]|jgi:hypothetical protein|nr:hypothetical protein [Spirochaetales bacterium]